MFERVQLNKEYHRPVYFGNFCFIRQLRSGRHSIKYIFHFLDTPRTTIKLVPTFLIIKNLLGHCQTDINFLTIILTCTSLTSNHGPMCILP